MLKYIYLKSSSLIVYNVFTEKILETSSNERGSYTKNDALFPSFAFELPMLSLLSFCLAQKDKPQKDNFEAFNDYKILAHYV